MEIRDFYCLFYFGDSEGGKIGPNTHILCNFLIITEIFFFYIRMIIKSRKQELNLEVSRVYMPKNRYAISCDFDFQGWFCFFVNQPLCDEYLCIDFFFCLT